MENTDLYYRELQNNIEKLDIREKYRKEQHDSSRIIFNREISPVQMYQNVMNNTVFIYKNRVPEDGKKVITGLKGIRRRRIAGSIIQWIGVLLIILFVLFTFNYKSVEWNNNIKLAFMLAILAGIPAFLIIGTSIKTSGRKFMIDYLDVWNPMKSPIEFNCLANGQLVLMKYARRDKSCGVYLSALNPDDTIWHGNLLNRMTIPTYADNIYVIDSIKSCTRTENGLMIESSGRFYGARRARCLYNNHHDTWLSVFAETHVSYRKDEIPAIFANMEQLEASLMNYGYFEPGTNTFSPL